jgi:hypothetical protein
MRGSVGEVDDDDDDGGIAERGAGHGKDRFVSDQAV